MKYRLGITERGDAGLDDTWATKLESLDGAVLITKNLTSTFQNAVMTAPYEKIIVHVGCTGYGGTVLEPHVPCPNKQLENALQLVDYGFPIAQMVIRVDPIIPTDKGLTRARSVIAAFKERGFTRFRVSVLDMYPHVRERFKVAGVECPYGDGFRASNAQFSAVDDMLASIMNLHPAPKSDNIAPSIRIESCAEPNLHIPIQSGCISAYDLELMGLDPLQADERGHQRSGCLCCSGKTELLTNKHRCPHQCLYCYWKE